MKSIMISFSSCVAISKVNSIPFIRNTKKAIDIRSSFCDPIFLYAVIDTTNSSPLSPAINIDNSSVILFSIVNIPSFVFYKSLESIKS
mgnify:CR=1 FL=1